MTRYTLLIEPEVHSARKHLPGNVRQQLKRAIESLVEDPRRSESQPLDVSGLEILPGVELRRLRIERWRSVYSHEAH